jgi:hypothetical protein
MLITAVGTVNVLIGLVFVGFGVYVLLTGADAVASVFQLQTESGKAIDLVAGKDQGEQAREAVGIFAQGLSGIIVAFSMALGGCAVLHGLPNLLVGVGVIVRSNVARVFAIVLAALALIEGLACLSGVTQSGRFLYLSLFLVVYAILTFVGLFGRRASFEFSGGLKGASTASEPFGNEAMSPVPSSTERRPVDILLLVVALMMTATAAVFATLYFTRMLAAPRSCMPRRATSSALWRCCSAMTTRRRRLPPCGPATSIPARTASD